MTEEKRESMEADATSTDQGDAPAETQAEVERVERTESHESVIERSHGGNPPPQVVRQAPPGEGPDTAEGAPPSEQGE
jgi:hypothetical protein